MVGRDGAREREALHLCVARSLQHADESVHVHAVVVVRVEGGDARNGEMHDVLNAMLLRDLLDDRRLRDVRLLDDDALAVLILDEARLTPRLVVRDDYFFPSIDERLRRMQTDESHASGDEYCHRHTSPQMLVKAPYRMRLPAIPRAKGGSRVKHSGPVREPAVCSLRLCLSLVRLDTEASRPASSAARVLGSQNPRGAASRCSATVVMASQFWRVGLKRLSTCNVHPCNSSE